MGAMSINRCAGCECANMGAQTYEINMQNRICTSGHKWEKNTLKITAKSDFAHLNKSISKLFFAIFGKKDILVTWGLYPPQGPLITAGNFSLLKNPEVKSFAIL